MKTFYILLIALSCAIYSSAANIQSTTVMADTIARIHTPSSVTVVKNDSTTIMKIVDATGVRAFEMELTEAPRAASETTDDNWGLHIPFLSDRGTRRVVEMTYFKDVYVGMLWGLETKGTCLSWEIGIPHVVGFSIYTGSRSPEISLGFGLADRFIYFGDGYKLDCVDGRMFLTPVPEGYKYSSHLEEFSLRVPLRIFQPIAHGFGIGAGVDAVFTTYVRGKASTKINNTKYNETYKGLNQRTFRPEFVGMLGWADGIGLYVRYSPVSSFKATNGPSFSTISFGLTCNF